MSSGTSHRHVAPLIIAHRGDSAHAPENTLPAFRAAVAKGAGGIELDLLLSRDDQVVVCHDERLLRLAGLRRRVRALDAAQLARVDVGARLFPGRRPVGIPTLRSVLQAVGSQVPLVLELKSPGGGLRRRDNRLLLARTLELIPRRTPHVLASFDAGLVRGALDAGRRAALIVSKRDAIGRLSAAERRRLTAISAAHDLLDARFVRRVARTATPLWVWTVDGEADVRRVLSFGVRAICGNDVARNRALVRRLWRSTSSRVAGMSR